jgi:hypothetical protein
MDFLACFGYIRLWILWWHGGRPRKQMTVSYTQEEYEQYLLAQRQALLAQVDAIETLLGLPKTSDLRRQVREMGEKLVELDIQENMTQATASIMRSTLLKSG